MDDTDPVKIEQELVNLKQMQQSFWKSRCLRLVMSSWGFVRRVLKVEARNNEQCPYRYQEESHRPDPYSLSNLHSTVRSLSSNIPNFAEGIPLSVSICTETMQCVREYGVLDSDLITQITAIAQSDESKFEKSELYSMSKGQKFIDETKRVSRFKKIKNDRLFDLVDEYVSMMSANDDLFEFLLFRNDITMIEYEKGGFFEKHEDYLSIKSNQIQEYSLILCISADCKGGETVLFINQMTDPYVSRHTVTPFHALLFRKDITHKGNRIESGHKTILTMNLWAFPKNESKRCVAVIFNEIDNTNSDRKYDGEFADESEWGKHSKHIVIPLSNVQSVPSTKLAQTLKAMDIDTGDQSTDKIIVHKEHEFSYEVYEIFSRIYKHCYVKMEEVIKFNSEIFAFGFESKHIFIDPAKSKKAKGVIYDSKLFEFSKFLNFFIDKISIQITTFNVRLLSYHH